MNLQLRDPSVSIGDSILVVYTPDRELSSRANEWNMFTLVD